MVTARLIDNIWATRKAETLNGCKLMLAQVIGGTRAGEQLVVVDTTVRHWGPGHHYHRFLCPPDA